MHLDPSQVSTSIAITILKVLEKRSPGFHCIGVLLAYKFLASCNFLTNVVYKLVLCALSSRGCSLYGYRPFLELIYARKPRDVAESLRVCSLSEKPLTFKVKHVTVNWGGVAP